MSLIAWYPLIRDLKNQGLDNNDLSQSNTAITYTGGLYGSSATFTQESIQYLYRPKITQNKNITITGWFKISQFNGQMFFFNCANGQGTKGWSIWSGYPSKTLYYQFGDIKWNYANHPMPLNTWFHLAMVVDNESKYYFYLNGEQLTTGTITTLPDYSDGDYISICARRYNAATDQPLYGQAQDFRIYNHALSTKEIKELSKGLILHHALKGYGAGENILSLNSLYHSSIEYESDMGQTVFVRDTTAITESYLGWGRTPRVEQSTQYTFSCMLWLDDNVKSTEFFWLSDTEENKKTGSGFVNITSTNGTSDTIRINNELKRNQWNYITWTFTTKADDYTGYIRIDNNGSKTEGEHAIIKACCPKLEKGSKATPFLPYTNSLEIKNLPSGYTQLEYIEGTGTQYINTGYVHKATTRIDIVCELSNCVNQDYGSLFGSRKGTNAYNDFSFYTISGLRLTFIYARTGKQISTTNNMLFNEKILISAYDTKCSWYKYGSSTAYGSITNTGTIDAGFNNMTLFCINKSTTADGFSWDRPPIKAKIYSCKIWDDDGITLVRDFIPAIRKSDSKLGLYDIVNDVFYANAGTGEFLTSPDIIEEDLSGNGFNGTRQGVTFTPDSPRYYISTEFDANKDLVLDRIFHKNDEVSNLSVSIWFKYNTSLNIWNLGQNGFWRIRPISSVSLQSLIYMGTALQDVRTTLSPSITTNTWYHLVMTFDNGIIKSYLNGELTDTVDKTSVSNTIKCTSSIVRWSLGDYAYNQEKFIGNLSDFRIYATTLTADNIKELYQTSAAIDKSGKMFCGEFVEE